MKITTVGLDLAKNVFQAHGVDEKGAIVLVKRLQRKQILPFFLKLPPCVIAMKPCATAHHWARTLAAMGHEVRLIPLSYLKTYVNTARAMHRMPKSSAKLCAASHNAFVPVKSVDQQSILMVHRARVLLVRQRTMMANALRAFGGAQSPCKSRYPIWQN